MHYIHDSVLGQAFPELCFRLRPHPRSWLGRSAIQLGCEHLQLRVSGVGNPGKSTHPEVARRQVYRDYDIHLGNSAYLSYRCKELCWHFSTSFSARYVRSQHQSRDHEYLLALLHQGRATTSNVHIPGLQRNGHYGRCFV